MTSPSRLHRRVPHRTVSAPVSSSDLARKLLQTTPPSGPSQFLLPYTALPHWSRDNAYILTSYRPCPTNSFAKCLQSLLYTHNETVNIHSHLLGAFLFLFAGVFLWLIEGRGPHSPVHPEDVWAFGCFFIGVVACLGMSAGYHTVRCHSEGVASWANRGDYVGIVALIWGSFVPSLWYGLRCEEGLRMRYWGMVSLEIFCSWEEMWGISLPERDRLEGVQRADFWSYRSPSSHSPAQPFLSPPDSAPQLGVPSALPFLLPWASPPSSPSSTALNSTVFSR